MVGPGEEPRWGVGGNFPLSEGLDTALDLSLCVN